MEGCVISDAFAERVLQTAEPQRGQRFATRTLNQQLAVGSGLCKHAAPPIEQDYWNHGLIAYDIQETGTKETRSKNREVRGLGSIRSCSMPVRNCLYTAYEPRVCCLV